MNQPASRWLLAFSFCLGAAACSPVAGEPAQTTGTGSGGSPAPGAGGSGGSPVPGAGGSGGSPAPGAGGSGGSPVPGAGGSGGSPAGPGPVIGDASGVGGAPAPRADGSVFADAAPAVDQAAPTADAAPPLVAIPPAGFTCPAGPFGDPLPANRVATLIKAQAGSLEGPVWVEGQNALYFCVVGPVAGTGRIDKYSAATRQITPFVTGVDVAGLALSPKGAIVATAFDKRMLSEFDPVSGKRTDIAGSNMYLGKPLNQTNDLVVRSDGNIYFTDTDYRQDGRAGQETTAHYRFSPTGQITRTGAGPEPNGIALSPDGRTLYVSSTGGDPLRKFTLDDGGAVMGAPVTFSPSSSDGMAVDCAGNVYLSTAGTIRVISPAGTVLGSITGLGTSTVSNAAFGGPDHKTLFITTASALYQITLNIPGFPS
jgi:gluconolactonase